MLQLVPSFWRRIEFASAPCIAVSFWALAVLVHVKLQGGVTEPLVLGAMLLCCLLALGFGNRRRWQSLGTPGLLLLASMASYLLLSSSVSLATDAELLIEDVARQGFFFLVTLAAMLGGGWLLERIGAETLLKWILVILVASCAVILASPLLRDIGVLPEYRHPFRMTGTFTDPNDAGFIGCMSAVLALAFQSNGRQRPLGCLALVLGCATALASVSYTAVIVLGGILTVFLLLNIRRLRQDLWHTGLTALCLAGTLVWLIPGTPGTAVMPMTPSTPATPSTPLQYVDEASVVGARGSKQVGGKVIVFLVNDQAHRADDDPVNPWRWQRADARLGDADAAAPDNATWTTIEGARSPHYVPVDEDEGKFLRADVSYEKNGRMYWVQTEAIGPIVPKPAAPTATATYGEALARLVKEPGETVATFRGTVATFRGKNHANSSAPRTLSRRLLLWEMGFDRVLESPIVGHGLYRLHHLKGAPIGHQGTPLGVHNVYLMLFGEAGVVPFVLYLLSLFFLARLLWTVPKSLGRDLVVGWAIVTTLYGLSFHHLLTMGATNFIVGLTCAVAAFLVRGQRPTTE